MKRSLTALYLLLCLACVAAAQGPNANVGANANTNVNSNVNANANGNVGANTNVNGSTGTSNGNTSPLTLEVHPGETAKITVGKQGDDEGGLSPLFKDWVDILAKVLGLATILFAALSYLNESRKNRRERLRERRERAERRRKERAENEKDREQSELNRQQREQDVEQRKTELRWKKAQLAKEVLDGLYADPYASDAMVMLDWNARTFRVKPNKNQTDGEMMRITWPEMWAALRITELHFNDKEKFIRDCFDSFFGYMQIIEHYIAIDLIDPADVRYPFDYYVSSLDRNALMFDNFIDAYHPRAASLIECVKTPERFRRAAPPSAEKEEPATKTEAAPKPIPAVAYYVFDCPPRAERFVLMLEDEERIKEARSVLSSEVEWHVSGWIVEAPVHYNPPWPFHVEPASVNFQGADVKFADDVNALVERHLGAGKECFRPDDIWHTGGARLLAELPAWRFDHEEAMMRDEQQEALRVQGRVQGAADADASSPGVESLSEEEGRRPPGEVLKDEITNAGDEG
ncbi:MAG TPA: hypothetical protein VGP08_10260 [Pyrinomonadaceae bacterium]|jgi:hypothetical protein|nr:hypothetical protein [Pyrinomonadaceae bacterium]